MWFTIIPEHMINWSVHDLKQLNFNLRIVIPFKIIKFKVIKV